MKRFKKILAGILSGVMMMTMTSTLSAVTAYAAVANAAPTNPFEIITEVYGYGQDVKAVVIDTGKSVKTESIDVDTFSVSTTNLNPKTGEPVYEGARAITKAYVNDSKTADGLGKTRGQYIILELQTGFELPGASALIYAGGNNMVLTMNYTIAQNKTYQAEEGNVDPSDVSYEKSGEINLIVDDFAYGTSAASGYDYRFFTPEKDEGEKYPLVVWLHGGGERPTTVSINEAQIRANMGGVAWAQPQNQMKNPCYVLAPQSSGWEGDKVVALIKEITAANPDIDTARIYIAGCSMGGKGTWSTILENPNLFAAAITAPGGSTADAETLSAVKDLPLWMVQTGTDTFAATEAAYNTLTSIDANVKWTHFEPGENGYPNDHWSWVPTLNNFYSQQYGTSIMNWLFSQKNPNKTFDIQTEVFPYGQDVTAVIIDAGSEVNASAIDAETFAVNTTNINATNNTEVYKGTRAITKAYVNDSKTTDGIGKDSGRYIILELEHGFELPGASALIYAGGYNTLMTMNYQVSQLKAYQTAAGIINVDEYRYKKVSELNLIVDEFAYATSEASGYDYRYFTPEKTEGKTYPLVIWLHGAGERATTVTTNEAQIRANMGGVAWALPENQAKNPSYVLAPQSTGWDGAKVVALVKEFVAANPDIDKTRIYIAGCSMGGRGTWNTILTEPELFAAAITAPGGSTESVEILSAVKDLPIWMVQTGADTLAATEAAYNTLTSIDANIRWTHFDVGGNGYPNDHWSWVPTLNNFYSEEFDTTIMDWLFSQRNTTGSFEIVTEVFEYGQDVTAVVIDAGKAINASQIDTDTFAVSTTNIKPFDETVAYQGAREITKAYVSNTKTVDGTGTDSGRYIILELKYGFTVQGATSLVYKGANYVLDMRYSVDQLKDYTLENGKTIAAVEATYPKVGEINLIVDDFEYGKADGAMYRMYTPDQAGKGKALPLVLWNHGAGETFRGTNEGVQIRANMGGVAWVQDEYPSYVIAPQRGTAEYTTDKIIAMIDKMIADGLVDANRVYIAGCSAGGAETIKYLNTYPGFFAAGIPICPAGSFTQQQARQIKDTPMWFFHSIDDPTLKVEGTRTKVDMINTLNPVDLKYTEVENLPYSEHGVNGLYNGHWSWILPLNNYDSEAYGTNVFDWLFAQKKVALKTEILEYVIELAEAAKADGALDGVIDIVTEKFNAALDRANEVLENAKTAHPTVIQDDIDSAQANVLEIMGYLEFKGDKTMLNKTIEIAKVFEANKGVYIPSTYIAFEKALATARAVAADGNALNDEITQTWKVLVDAMSNLRRIPNKDALENLKNQALKINPNLYTPRSVAALNSAVNVAETVLADVEASEQDVMEAKQLLGNALNGLEAIDAGTVVDNTPTVIVTSTNNAGTAANAKTSDNAPLALAVALSMMSGLAVLCLKKRR